MPNNKIKQPKTDKELINYWAHSVQRGDSFRKRIYTDAQWKRFEQYFRHKYPNQGYMDNAVESRQRLMVQRDAIVAREARKMIPKVVFGLPYLKVKPLAGRTPVHAKVLERVINGILDQIHFSGELRKIVLSATQHGTSYLKKGYDSMYVPSYKQLASVGFSDAAFDKKGRRREFSDRVFPGLPWVSWQHPRNVIYPEMLENFHEARWVAFRYFRHLSDIQNDERLKNTADLKPIGYRYAELDPDLAMEMPRYPVLQDKVMLVEVRDRETGKMYIFAEDYDRILYKEEDVLMSVLGGKLPIEPVVFNENTDYAYGTSDIEMVEEELKELMDLRTQHVKARRLAIPKFAYQQNTIDPEELRRLTSGSVGAGIKVQGNPDSALKFFDLSARNDFMQEEMDLERRIKAQFGAHAFDVFPSSRRGNPEVQGAQQEGTISVNERQKILRDAVVQIGKDIAEMVFSFWTEDTVVDILAPVTAQQMDPATGQMQEVDITKQVWVSFTGRELRGNFDYYIVPTTGRFQDSRASKEEAFELIGMLGKIPGINLPELIRQLGDRFEGLDVDKLFPPMNQPGMPMQMSQLQGMMGQGQNQINRQKVRLPPGV